MYMVPDLEHIRYYEDNCSVEAIESGECYAVASYWRAKFEYENLKDDCNAKEAYLILDHPNDDEFKEQLDYLRNEQSLLGQYLHSVEVRLKLMDYDIYSIFGVIGEFTEDDEDFGGETTEELAEGYVEIEPGNFVKAKDLVHNCTTEEQKANFAKKSAEQFAKDKEEKAEAIKDLAQHVAECLSFETAEKGDKEEKKANLKKHIKFIIKDLFGEDADNITVTVIKKDDKE